MSDSIHAINRREFLRSAAVTAAAAAISTSAGAAQKQTLARRRFGRTDIEVSVVAFSGLMLSAMTQERADKAVARAVEEGVNIFDVAPAYGSAEEKMGPALKPFRKNVFLCCKTRQRTAEGAAKELKRSFERLQTDHFDLYQLHAIVDVQKDVEAALGRGGAMETILAAKKAGQIRYIGITAHTTEAAVAAMEKFDFDSIMFPLNLVSFHTGDFGPKILQTAVSKGMAVLAIKPLCRQEWPSADYRKASRFRNMWYEPISDAAEAELAVRWALSQPITTILPPANEEVFFLATQTALGFRPLDEPAAEQVKALAGKLKPLFRAGKIIG